jgi:hypothetical protein
LSGNPISYYSQKLTSSNLPLVTSKSVLAIALDAGIDIKTYGKLVFSQTDNIQQIPATTTEIPACSSILKDINFAIGSPAQD